VGISKITCVGPVRVERNLVGSAARQYARSMRRRRPSVCVTQCFFDAVTHATNAAEEFDASYFIRYSIRCSVVLWVRVYRRSCILSVTMIISFQEVHAIVLFYLMRPITEIFNLPQKKNHFQKVKFSIDLKC
jgi:hypothetical protein